MFTWRSAAWRVAVVVMALVVLYLGGWGMDQLDLDVHYDCTFFQLRYAFMADTPFWFLAGLVVLVANGIFLLRWGNFEGRVRTPRECSWWPFGSSEYGVNVPLPTLKMLALNLLLMPAIWFIYIIIASVH